MATNWNRTERPTLAAAMYQFHKLGFREPSVGKEHVYPCMNSFYYMVRSYGGYHRNTENKHAELVERELKHSNNNCKHMLIWRRMLPNLLPLNIQRSNSSCSPPLSHFTIFARTSEHRNVQPAWALRPVDQDGRLAWAPLGTAEPEGWLDTVTCLHEMRQKQEGCNADELTCHSQAQVWKKKLKKKRIRKRYSRGFRKHTRQTNYSIIGIIRWHI